MSALENLFYDGSCKGIGACVSLNFSPFSIRFLYTDLCYPFPVFIRINASINPKDIPAISPARKYHSTLYLSHFPHLVGVLDVLNNHLLQHVIRCSRINRIQGNIIIAHCPISPRHRDTGNILI